ncbi:MAG: porin [Comamonas sp.]|nr:porin [Comamonas sp.]
MTKTTRLMLAVLAVCGTSAALAQSSVNLYGRINTTIENQKLGNASATGMVTNSSFIGFKGVEDLGNGLKAGFVLEANFNSDDGAGPLNFKRNSEVNLSGGFGMLRLGSFDPYSYTVTADTISMHNHDTGTSADMLYFGAAGRGNTIAYRTPDIAGFNAEVQYRFGEKAGAPTTEDKGGWDLGANYANGPLGLGFGYSQQKLNDLVAGGNEKESQFALRGSYAIGDLTLGAYYQKQKAEEAGIKSKRDAYRLAAMYTIGASELHANVGRATKVKVGGTKVGDSATQWTLAYNYNLSKRTKVYALYTNLNHVDSATSEPMGFGSLATSNTGGDKFRSIGVGIRHLF